MCGQSWKDKEKFVELPIILVGFKLSLVLVHCTLDDESASTSRILEATPTATPP
jgi:hypothetical protein